MSHNEKSPLLSHVNIKDLDLHNQIRACSVHVSIQQDLLIPETVNGDPNQGLVVQSVVSLTSSLAAKMLTVLVSTISNSQVFLLKKNVSKCKSYSHFSAKILVYMQYLMIC